MSRKTGTVGEKGGEDRQSVIGVGMLGPRRKNLSTEKRKGTGKAIGHLKKTKGKRNHEDSAAI